jgi:hypothetical protein
VLCARANARRGDACPAHLAFGPGGHHPRSIGHVNPSQGIALPSWRRRYALRSYAAFHDSCRSVLCLYSHVCHSVLCLHSVSAPITVVDMHLPRRFNRLALSRVHRCLSFGPLSPPFAAASLARWWSPCVRRPTSYAGVRLPHQLCPHGRCSGRRLSSAPIHSSSIIWGSPVPSAPHWWCSCARHSGRHPSSSPMQWVPSTSTVGPCDSRASAQVQHQYVRARAAQQPARMVSPLPMRGLSGTAIPLFSSPYVQTVYSNTSVFHTSVQLWWSMLFYSAAHAPAIPWPACAYLFAFFFTFPSPLPFPTHLASVSFTLLFLRSLLFTIAVSCLLWVHCHCCNPAPKAHCLFHLLLWWIIVCCSCRLLIHYWSLVGLLWWHMHWSREAVGGKLVHASRLFCPPCL